METPHPKAISRRVSAPRMQGGIRQYGLNATYIHCDLYSTVFKWFLEAWRAGSQFISIIADRRTVQTIRRQSTDDQMM